MGCFMVVVMALNVKIDSLVMPHRSVGPIMPSRH